MNEKALTELEWKMFARKHELGKDAAFTPFARSLAALERADSPALRLVSLKEIAKQVGGLDKQRKASKELDAYLDDVEKLLDKQRKSLEPEARGGASSKPDASDEEGPAALGPGKLLPLLRQVAKGEGSLPAIVALAGKAAAVLVSARPVGNAQKKLLAEQLGTTSGVKYFAGECLWEANAHTFVLEARVSGLAKLVTAALQAQTDTRFKVRVRGNDPKDVEEDEEPGEGESVQPQQTGKEPSAEQRSYEARMAGLKARIATALTGEPGQAAKLKTLLGFVTGKTAEGQYAGALQGLEAVAKLLDAPQAQPVPKAPPLPEGDKPREPEATTPQGEAFKEGLAALLPRLKTEAAAGNTAAGEARLKASEAGTLAAKRDYAGAMALLQEAAALLEEGAEQLKESKEPLSLSAQDRSELSDIVHRQAYRVDDETKRLLGALKSEDPRKLSPGERQFEEELEAQAKLLERLRGGGDLSAEAYAQQALANMLSGPEGLRAERLRKRLAADDPEGVAQARRFLDPNMLAKEREQALAEGWGLTADGLYRYALPVTSQQWGQGVAELDGLLLELRSAAASGGADAVALRLSGRMSALDQVAALSTRLQAHAIDSGESHESSARIAATQAVERAVSVVYQEVARFNYLPQPDLDAPALLAALNELLPHLDDYAAPAGVQSLEEVKAEFERMRPEREADHRRAMETLGDRMQDQGYAIVQIRELLKATPDGALAERRKQELALLEKQLAGMKQRGAQLEKQWQSGETEKQAWLMRAQSQQGIKPGAPREHLERVIAAFNAADHAGAIEAMQAVSFSLFDVKGLQAPQAFAAELAAKADAAGRRAIAARLEPLVYALRAHQEQTLVSPEKAVEAIAALRKTTEAVTGDLAS